MSVSSLSRPQILYPIRQARLHQGYVSWLSAHDWDIALTLNFKPDIRKETARKAARHYWQKLDCWLYGSNAVQRNNTRLPRVCFLEGEDQGRNWHIHSAIKAPAPDAIKPKIAGEDFKLGMCAALTKRWEETFEAGRFSKAELIYDCAGWVRYISKDVNIDDCEFCLTTSHIADRRDTM